MQNSQKPPYVADLEAVFGPPSQEAFGSAVFYVAEKIADLSEAALEKYRYFVGDLWEQWGEDAWIGPWKEVYARETGATKDVVSELKGIKDPDAMISVPLFLEVGEDPKAMQSALSVAFNDPAVTELRIFNIGDGSAMSGLQIAGLRKESSEATFVIVLMD